MGKHKTTTSIENNTRTLEIKDGYLIFTLKSDGKKDYMTYNETLYQILQLDKLKPFRDNRRLRFKVLNNGMDYNFYSYDLAYACYWHKIKLESFILDMQKHHDMKCTYDLEVDHADSNTNNNTIYNLSLISSKLNSIKSSISARVKEPAYLFSGYYDSEYRVCLQHKVKSTSIPIIADLLKPYSITMQSEHFGAMIRFVCPNAERYVECLKWCVETQYEWAMPLRIGTSWVANDNKCFALNIHNSLSFQRTLASVDREEFNEFIQHGGQNN